MNKQYYRAFGLVIESEFPIVQVPVIEACRADVRIVSRPDLTVVYPPAEQPYSAGGAVFFRANDVAHVRITGTDLIEVEKMEGCDDAHLSVFLMGSAMGAILHHRGFMPLHGSCVTDGVRSVFITGDSGAGKSTLAAEFLKQGWKLITDDVSAVFDVEKTPMVQSSYPSQKLWQDSLDHYERPGGDIHSLYSREDREKFGVDVSRFFYEGTAPLSLIVRLVPAEYPCAIGPITGMAKTDQLMRNTYRINMIEKQDLQRHFQRCVTLSQKVPMALVIREKDRQCADVLYNMIVKYLGGMQHG